VGWDNHVCFCVGHVEGPAEGTVEFVVQKHPYGIETGAAEPDAVEGF
jgi:hypothetical protein